jgi:hypothetical protein
MIEAVGSPASCVVSRIDKLDHYQTVLYEIDMLRFSHKRMFSLWDRSESERILHLVRRHNPDAAKLVEQYRANLCSPLRQKEKQETSENDRSRANIFRCDRPIRIEKRSDISARLRGPQANKVCAHFRILTLTTVANGLAHRGGSAPR